MTEDEAKKKWCPFSRVQAVLKSLDFIGVVGANRIALSDEVEPNRDGDKLNRLNPESARCIASECMAWRWLPRLDTGEPQKGFCGLAGDRGGHNPPQL